MKGTVVFHGSTSAAFNIRSRVKQGCILAPTLFGIFFAVMLKHTFGPSAEGIYLRTRTDRKLFNLSRLRAKTKVQLRCLHDFLFADDAAVTAHSAEDLQQLMTHFSDACQDFGLTTSLKKTQIMGQDVDSPPAISINDHELDVIHDFVYLGSTISDTLSLDTGLNNHIGKAATTMTRLTKKAWNNSKLTEHTKIQIYRACVVSTLLFGSESWTLRSLQERKLNASHMRSLRCILNITWTKFQTTLTWKELGTSMFTLLARPHCAHGRRTDSQRSPLQRTCAWTTNAFPKTSSTDNLCMDDGWIPKDLLYRERWTDPQRSPLQRTTDGFPKTSSTENLCTWTTDRSPKTSCTENLCMDDGRIPKDLLYRELVHGRRTDPQRPPVQRTCA